MADSKIKDLTAKTPAVDTDELIINDAAGGNLDKKLDLSVVKTYTSLSPTLVTPASLGVQQEDLNLDGNNVDNGGVIYLKEQAEADADVTGSGQIWVDTATPNTLMFTDDAGTDFTVASKTGTNAPLETFAIALSDETTVLGAASDSVPLATFHIPYAFTVTSVKAGLTTAGTGAALITCDIHEAGTTILSTKITIDASEKTSATAATQPVISDSALASDALIECFLDTRDTNNLATGLKIYITGYQT